MAVDLRYACSEERIVDQIFCGCSGEFLECRDQVFWCVPETLALKSPEPF